MDDFFRIVSKILVIFPIIIIIIGLILKYNEKPEKPLLNSSIKNQTSNYSKPKITLKPTIPKEKITIDFQGPLVCRYQEKDLKIVAYIKNNKINLEVNSKNEIKKYDLSSYLPFIKMILENNDRQGINNLLKMYSDQDLDIKKLMEYCKKENF